MTPNYVENKVRRHKKNYGIIWEYMGGLLNSQNFCKLTKYFFVFQIHSEVLKHVISDKFYHLKFISFGVSVVHSGKKTGSFGNFSLEGEGGMGPLSPKVNIQILAKF